MTAILIAIAVLSLAAGFYILISGRRNPDSGTPAQHKVNIRKASEPAQWKVDDSPPDGLSALECAAAELEEEDPIDIFLDFDLPLDFRMEAAEKLEKDSGFKFYTKLKPDNNQQEGENDCDVETNEEPATDMTYADLSNNRIVAAKIVEQNRNILALMARTPFMEYTSISALESNGSMHTYIVRYKESPAKLIVDTREPMLVALEGKSSRKNVTSNRMTDAPTLPQVSSASQRLYHLGVKEYEITALCEDIISYSDVTYISLSVRNGSSVSYDIKDATFVIESKKRNKRSVVIEKTIFPEGRHGSLNCPAGDNTKIAYSFKKMTLSRDQVLRVYFYENNGQRNLQLTIDTNDINKAAGSL